MKINCELKGIKKKIFVGLAVVMALVMASGSFAMGEMETPSGASYDKPRSAAANGIMGDFNVTGDTSGCSFSGDVLTVSGGAPTISMAAGKVSTAQRISVTGAATITLAGVNIKPNSGAALSITDDASFNVNILLGDDTTNTLDSSNDESGAAGLQKSGGSGMLTIGAAGSAGTGRLMATGGFYSAGIGGGNSKGTSHITITGGIINANGGDDGSGIGGGFWSSGSDIIISGGLITATGDGMAAGIGGGYHGTGSNINISGGVIAAYGASNGAGIGGGYLAKGSNNTLNGDAVVVAVSNSHGGLTTKDPLDGFNTLSNGIAFTKQGATGTWNSAMYGNSVKVTENVQFPSNFTIANGKAVTLGENKTLTMASGATLTVASGGTLVNDGILTEDDSIVCQNGGTIKTQLVFYETEGDFNTRAGSTESTIYKSGSVIQKYQDSALIILPNGAEGWYSDWYGKGQKIATTENVQLNLHTACANYLRTVKFNTQQATVTVPDQNLNYGDKVTEPVSPIIYVDNKHQYIEGWYKDAACTTKWNFDTDTVTSQQGTDTILYAKWVDCLKVTFNLQGGTAADGEADVQYLKSGDFAQEPDQTKITKEGYVFKDWYTNPAGTGVSYDFDHTPVTGNLTLYAVWGPQTSFRIDAQQPEHGHIEYPNTGESNTTIRFEVHAEDEGWQVKNGSVTVTTASGTNIPVTKVTANSDGEEDDYTFTMPSENVTITAEMEKITYTVTFKSQNGASDITVPVKYGDTVAKPGDPTFAGHKFNGWYDNNQGDGDAYNFATPISGDLTLYANWLTIYNVGLNKEGNGNVNFNQTQAVKGDTITFTLTPETGWYISGFPTFTPEGGQPEHVTLDIQNPNTYKFTMPDKAVTVNVVFRISTHMVRFYSQADDVQPPSTQLVKYGEYTTEPEDPVRSNYQFVGWYTNPEGSGETFDFDCVPVTEDISLYAVWLQNAYPIIWQQPEHGDIQSVKAAIAYTDVKFRVHALNEDKETYELSNITLTAADGTEVKFDKVVSNGIGDDDDLYHFTMPNSAVTISAAFEPIPDPGPGPEPTPDSSVVPGQGGGSNGNGASSKTGDAFAGGVALAILGVASTVAVLLRKRK